MLTPFAVTASTLIRDEPGYEALMKARREGLTHTRPTPPLREAKANREKQSRAAAAQPVNGCSVSRQR